MKHTINGTQNGERKTLNVQANTREEAIEKVRLARPDFQIHSSAEPFGQPTKVEHLLGEILWYVRAAFFVWIALLIFQAIYYLATDQTIEIRSKY